jgi:site-specific recombinase XerD
MLKHYITSSVSLGRLQATPCWPYLDGYTDWLAAKRYAQNTIQLYLFGIVPLGRWMATNAVSVTLFDHHALASFRHERARLGKLRHSDGRKLKAAFLGARRFHEFLIADGVFQPALPIELPASFLLSGFDQWMTTHRGTRQTTLSGYALYIKGFVAALGHDPEAYDARAVRAYLLEHANRSRARTAQCAATAIRVFLRYLVATGQCNGALPNAVPKHAHWRLSSLPRYITNENVERLITSCQESIRTALRDRSILLLLARLALRAGDVAALELADIDWREGRIRVSGKNRCEFWLPLPQEVGDAIVDYLQNERPESDGSHLFVKSIAPTGPLSRSVVSSIVRRAVERTGVDAPSKGAHLLRHSAATEMLRQGATLAQIGSVLRHVDIETTAIYAKVDPRLLDAVSAPWPCRSRSAQIDDSVVANTGEQSC